MARIVDEREWARLKREAAANRARAVRRAEAARPRPDATETPDERSGVAG